MELIEGFIPRIKGITVKRFKELLSELEDDYILAPNRVNNLNIYDSDLNSLGDIDLLLEGEIEWYEGIEDDD